MKLSQDMGITYNYFGGTTTALMTAVLVGLSTLLGFTEPVYYILLTVIIFAVKFVQTLFSVKHLSETGQLDDKGILVNQCKCD